MSCYLGYSNCVKFLTNRRRSHALSGSLSLVDNFFFVADLYLGNIYQVDAVGGAIGQLLPFGVASGPTGLAYDPTVECVYWADVYARTINRYSLRNNINTVIHRDPSNTGKYQQFISTYK